MDEVVPSFSAPSSIGLERLLKGALAGLIATVPMSIFMQTAWMMLPEREKYPLPPRQIIDNVTKRLGRRVRLNDDERIAATLLAHLGYGTAAGSLYAMLDSKIPLDSRTKGALAGLIVWMGSYLGWLPAVGILKPATEHPMNRNLLMILAHFIWGVTLGEFVRKLSARRWL